MPKQKEMTIGKDVEARNPPADWSDVQGWDRYAKANTPTGPFLIPTTVGALGWQSARFLSLVKARGGRVWFPGCGVDIGPRFYAAAGCTVVATDFSPVAIRAQRTFAALSAERMFAGWRSFAQQSDPPIEQTGHFEAALHDFTGDAPKLGPFDVVINCRAFQGLSPIGMRAAATHYFGALRPGGVAIIDTINVQGPRRNAIEDSLIEAGFFIPGNEAERWYREQLENTGIEYAMIMGRPRAQFNRLNPVKRSSAEWERGQMVLDSFAEEYRARVAEGQAAEEEIASWPETVTAIVVYSTG